MNNIILTSMTLFFVLSSPLHAAKNEIKNEKNSEEVVKALEKIAQIEREKNLAEQLRQDQLLKHEKKLREQIKEEHKIATEMAYYHSVVSPLSYEPTHPTLKLSPNLTQQIIKHGTEEMSGDKTIGYLLRGKFNRVLLNGNTVEWLWSLDLKNETAKKFFFSETIDDSKIPITIELFDANNFVITSFTTYHDIFLKRGKSLTLNGKWVLPYDQVAEVVNYKVSIGY